MVRAVPRGLRRRLPAVERRGVRGVPEPSRRPAGLRRTAHHVRRGAAVRRVLLRSGRLHHLRRRRRGAARPARRPVRPGHDRDRVRPRVRPRHPDTVRGSRPRPADRVHRTAVRLLRRRVGRAGQPRRVERRVVQRRRRAQRPHRHDEGERPRRVGPVRRGWSWFGVRPGGCVPGRIQRGRRPVRRVARLAAPALAEPVQRDGREHRRQRAVRVRRQRTARVHPDRPEPLLERRGRCRDGLDRGSHAGRRNVGGRGRLRRRDRSVRTRRRVLRIDEHRVSERACGAGDLRRLG